MVVPSIRSYKEQLECHVREVTSRQCGVLDPDSFLAIIEHLKSNNCCSLDYQKADLMMKVGHHWNVN